MRPSFKSSVSLCFVHLSGSCVLKTPVLCRTPRCSSPPPHPAAEMVVPSCPYMGTIYTYVLPSQPRVSYTIVYSVYCTVRSPLCIALCSNIPLYRYRTKIFIFVKIFLNRCYLDTSRVAHLTQSQNVFVFLPGLTKML